MKIKLCGLTRPQDILAVNEYQPDYVGFVINFPQSHRSVSPQRVYELTEQLLPSIPVVGVTVNQTLEYNAALLEDGIVDIVQLHGQEDDAFVRALQQRTEKPVWKAFRIRSEADLEQARSSSADMILLDNGYGTGEAFDWTLIRDIGRPFILAGGLNQDNLAEAAKMAPFAVDLSSGAETNQRKDPQKIRTLIEIVRRLP
ncbi:MAG: phosphoribosylanthranilate isomerase [Butyricicoccus sp.]